MNPGEVPGLPVTGWPGHHGKSARARLGLQPRETRLKVPGFTVTRHDFFGHGEPVKTRLQNRTHFFQCEKMVRGERVPKAVKIREVCKNPRVISLSQ